MSGSVQTLTTSFEALARVLTWDRDEADTIRTFELRYLDALSWSLGETLGRAIRHDSRAGAELTDIVRSTSTSDLATALLLPATSRRLITDLHPLPDVVSHLGETLPTPPVPEVSNAYLGAIGSSIPVFAPGGERNILQPLLQRLEDVLERLGAACPPCRAYVTQVMRELHLRVDPTLGGFASNSPQGLVGRAVLTNPHLDDVDDVVLAEALVHEATHGFVGMSEAVGLSGASPDGRWLLDDYPYDGVSRVVSPWTGTPLDIPTYLHACFVWWGLLHFWGRVAGVGGFDRMRIRRRIVRAANGFVSHAHVEVLAAYEDIVSPALFEQLAVCGDEVEHHLAASGLGNVLNRPTEVSGT